MKYRRSLVYHKTHYVYFTIKNLLENFGNVMYLTLHKTEMVNNGVIVVTHEANKRGASILAGHIAKEISNQGYHVFIISKQCGDLCDEYNKIGNFKITLTQHSFKKTISTLYLLGYNTIILNTCVNGDFSRLSKQIGLKVISLIHETLPAISDLCAEKKVVEMIRYSEKVIYPTHILKQEIEQVYGISNNSIVMPQGLYLNGGTSHSEIIKKNRVLAVGDVSIRKGFDIFVEIAKRFVDKADFFWVGNGRDSKFYYETLEKNGNVFPDNFHFYKDMSSADLLAFYSTASVFALTSRYDTFPSVMLESMNAGVPVVGFEKSGGIIELVVNGYNGLLVKEMENITAMSEAINHFLDIDLLEKQNISKNCKKTAEKYSFQNYVAQIIS